MNTFLILIAPLPLLVLYVRLRSRDPRNQTLTGSEQPTASAKPYEPEPSPSTESNSLLRFFPVNTQLYLRQQWTVASFGFLASLWILTVLLCASMLPPIADKLPTKDQRVWFSFVTGASVWSSQLPVLLALFAAIFAGTGIVGAAAVYTRTRPIPLRVMFWGRILPAIASLLLALAVSIGVAFSALRVAYGPVWKSIPAYAVSSSPRHELLQLSYDETTEQAIDRRIQWLSQNPTPRMLASAFTSTTLCFSVCVLAFSRPFGANKKLSTKAMSGIVPLMSFGAIITSFVLSRASPSGPPWRIWQWFFFSPPYQIPPPWRFALIPVGLSVALLLVSERLYFRRDV